MTISDSVPKRTLKIRISSKKAELVLDSVSREISQKPYVNDECVHNISISGSKESMTQKSQKTVPDSSDSLKLNGAGSFRATSPMQSSGKRGPPGAVDFVMNKRQKIDHSLKQECGRILESMIKHPAAVGFLEPVDPVKLNIPDYFSVISKPMDLGTVGSKLQDNMYSCAKEFKADVRLTFSNAILYNPPGNYFNKMAKKLESMFNTKWRYLEARLKGESINCEEGIIPSFRERKMAAHRHLSSRRSPAQCGLYSRVSFVEKRKMTKERVSFVEKRKMTKEHGEETIGKMTEKVEPARNSQNSTYSERVFRKGTDGGNRSTCVRIKTISSLSVVATKCHSCGNLKCQCCLRNAHASSKVLISERSLGQDCGASKMERESGQVPNTSKSDPESDGAVSALDEESIYSSPPPSSLGWTPAVDLQLSPKRALRAAMLKSRFADTIFKAKRKTLLVHEEKVDPVKMQQEREKLERQQKEEKARIEAQIRAAEVALSQKAKERERKRETARLAIQKIEQTVVIDDNMKFLKELDVLRLAIPNKSELFCEPSQDGRFGNILEQLGLFIKDDKMDDEYAEEELIMQDIEEGQIC